MREFFLEMLFILSFSKRTQWVLLLGFIGFITFKLLGQHMLSDFELHGMMAPLTEIVRSKIGQRYDSAAFMCLVSSWLAAVRFYCKDKKRFFAAF